MKYLIWWYYFYDTTFLPHKVKIWSADKKKRLEKGCIIYYFKKYIKMPLSIRRINILLKDIRFYSTKFRINKCHICTFIPCKI